MNEHPTIDWWILAYVIGGFIAARAGYRWYEIVAGAVVWEIAENTAKDIAPEFFPIPTPDTTTGALADVAAVTLGATLGGAL